jgi:hypothetical protein
VIIYVQTSTLLSQILVEVEIKSESKQKITETRKGSNENAWENKILKEKINRKR